MAENLVALAEEFVRLSTAIEDVRCRMKAALMNGVDPKPVRPQRHRLSRGGVRRKSILAEMRVQDGRVLETLKGGPLRQVDIARAMDVGQSSVAGVNRRHNRRAVRRCAAGVTCPHY
jgi:hypothetical protein